MTANCCVSVKEKSKTVASLKVNILCWCHWWKNIYLKTTQIRNTGLQLLIDSYVIPYLKTCRWISNCGLVASVDILLNSLYCATRWVKLVHGWKETIVSYGRNAEPPDQLGGRIFGCTKGNTEEVNKRASRCKLTIGLHRTGVTNENQGATHFTSHLLPLANK